MCLPVSKCCFCLSLDVGAKLISIINLISSVVTCMVYGTATLVPSSAVETRQAVYALVTTASLIQLIVGCVLLYGLLQKKPQLLIPWMVTVWIYCILLLGLSIFGAVLILINYTRDQDTADEISTMVSVYFLHGVVLYYFASVVSSRRDEMLNENNTESAHHLMRHRYFLKSAVV